MCVCVCLCVPCVCDALGGGKVASDPLNLELQMAVNLMKQILGTEHGHSQEQPALLLSEPSLHAPSFVFHF